MKETIEISPFGNNLIYRNFYDRNFIETTINERHLSGLKINTRWENLLNLDFLSEYDFLESLEIVGRGNIDFGFLDNLTRLKILTISVTSSSAINLSKLSKLEDFTVLWDKGDIFGLELCESLRSLCLVNYMNSSLVPISIIRNLKSLEIKTSSIKSLKGIEKLSNLSYLLLGNCVKLKDIQNLENLSMLTDIIFDICPNVYDYDIIKFLSKLEHIEIIDCNDVKGIEFIKNMPNLKNIQILGNTKIGGNAPNRELPQ